VREHIGHIITGRAVDLVIVNAENAAWRIRPHSASCDELSTWRHC